MFSEGNAAHRVGYDSMLSDSNDSLAQLFFNLNLLGLVWQPVAAMLTIMARFKLQKRRQTAITIYNGLSHPTRSLSRIVCRGKEPPIGSKGILRPDFQANNRPMIFLKANVTTRYRKESPLMIKKGLMTT
jgi:hypothetical protein